jgi:hemoglobin/transferrin/lactoferrin receptor protein
MLNMAAYISHAWELSEKWISTQGIRFTHVSLQSAWTDTMMNLTGFPFEKAFTQTNNAISGNLGFVFKAGKGWRLAINASSGFRAPNVDDAGKVNDSNSADNLLIIPNPKLKPEYSYTGEFTVGKLFGKNVWFENTVYYTLLNNAMVMRPTTLNGLDSVVFDGNLCAVQSNINAGSAYIYGVQSSLTAEVTSHFTIKSHLNYTYGRVDDGTPLDHIPPTFGQTSFRLQQKQFSGEFYVRYSSWKRLKDYSPSGEDNLTYATAYGMPSWTTLNVRAAYQFNKNVQLQVALENIMDTHYRKFASGISSPGRNFIVALRANF